MRQPTEDIIQAKLLVRQQQQQQPTVPSARKGTVTTYTWCQVARGVQVKASEFRIETMHIRFLGSDCRSTTGCTTRMIKASPTAVSALSRGFTIEALWKTDCLLIMKPPGQRLKTVGYDASVSGGIGCRARRNTRIHLGFEGAVCNGLQVPLRSMQTFMHKGKVVLFA